MIQAIRELNLRPVYSVNLFEKKSMDLDMKLLLRKVRDDIIKTGKHKIKVSEVRGVILDFLENHGFRYYYNDGYVEVS